MEKLILIDGAGLIYRGFYAIPPFFKSPSGQPTNAVFGFASIVLGILAKHKPDYLAVTMDMKGPTFRHKAFDAYKATRVKAPQELYDQIPLVRTFVEALGIPLFEAAGFEADDVIASIVRQFEEDQSLEIMIASGDFDVFQLVGPRVKILYPLKGFKEAVTMGEKEIEEKYSLKPKQIPDFKGLAGDSSDNLPGVKGIGEKGAKDLIGRYGSLENIYEHLQDITGSVQTKLDTQRDSAFLCKQLATLRDDVSIEFNLEDSRVRAFHSDNARALFSEFGFKSLIKRLNDFYPEVAQQESLF